MPLSDIMLAMMDYLFIGVVPACFVVCFSGISTVALACCPNRPLPELALAPVSPVSPVAE